MTTVIRGSPIRFVHDDNVAADLLMPGQDHLFCELGLEHHALFHLCAGEDGLLSSHCDTSRRHSL
jgi:hypothetical protein